MLTLTNPHLSVSISGLYQSQTDQNQQVNIGATVKEQLDIVTGRKSRAERRKAKEKRANYLRKKEARNMAV